MYFPLPRDIKAKEITILNERMSFMATVFYGAKKHSRVLKQDFVLLNSSVFLFVGSVWSLVCRNSSEDCPSGRNVSFICISH